MILPLRATSTSPLNSLAVTSLSRYALIPAAMSASERATRIGAAVSATVVGGSEVGSVVGTTAAWAVVCGRPGCAGGGCAAQPTRDASVVARRTRVSLTTQVCMV